MAVDWEIRLPLEMIPTQLEAATPLVLARAAEHLRGVAVARTPNRDAHLAGSAGITVTGAGVDAVAELKFEGPYAAFQNRGMRADGTHVIHNRPAGGQTGFLTDTMLDQEQAVLDIVADTIWQLIG